MKKDKLHILWYLFGVIFIAWLSSGIGLNVFFNDYANSGAFGDGFGAINSLFSGLAFAGIVYTILLQRKELELQREELRQTRVELKRSADSQELHLMNTKENNRIKHLPFFQISSEKISGTSFLTLQNVSVNPAFDVEIWLFNSIVNKSTNKVQFIENHCHNLANAHAQKDNLIDDTWAIHEKAEYITFPSKGWINIDLKFPTEINILDMFLQYRDVSGENYVQEINLIPGGLNSKPFVPASIWPQVPEPIERINYFESNMEDYPSFASDIYRFTQVSVFIGSLMDNLDLTTSNRWPMKSN